MTSMDVSSVLNSIKTAADALEEKPRLESRISELSREVDRLAAHNAGLESNIINYKSTIDSLNEKVRSLEVERDQAQFRTIELEDAFTKLGQTITAASYQLNASHNELYPQPPEPTPEPIAEVATAGQSEALLSVQEQPNEYGKTAESTGAQTTENAFQPTTTPISPGGAPSTPVPETPSLKYTGLTWSQAREKYGNTGPDAVTYVQSVWLDNGGTMENWHL